MLKENDCDILVIKETWFRKSSTTLYRITGYNGYDSCKKTRGGGNSIYYKHKINSFIQDEEEIYFPFSSLTSTTSG